jgi:hypothetical protein
MWGIKSGESHNASIHCEQTEAVIQLSRNLAALQDAPCIGNQ